MTTLVEMSYFLFRQKSFGARASFAWLKGCLQEHLHAFRNLGLIKKLGSAALGHRVVDAATCHPRSSSTAEVYYYEWCECQGVRISEGTYAAEHFAITQILAVVNYLVLGSFLRQLQPSVLIMCAITSEQDVSGQGAFQSSNVYSGGTADGKDYHFSKPAKLRAINCFDLKEMLRSCDSSLCWVSLLVHLQRVPHLAGLFGHFVH